MTRSHAAPALLAILLVSVPGARAGIELVTLPARDQVELTVYREVDLTLVRERRTLTFKKGLNRLEFSWAGTQIDPTSLELAAAGEGGRFDVLDRSYPPRVAKTLVWTVETDRSGPRDVELSYFTAGVSWTATYQAVAGVDGAAMTLEGDLRISNASGEDFEGARVRLVVGHVRLVETIAALAAANDRRGHAVAAEEVPSPMDELEGMAEDSMPLGKMAFADGAGFGGGGLRREAKKIMKEGLADQYLFSVPGTEDLRAGWSLRLPSVRAAAVPFSLVYKFDEERWGAQVRSFFRLHNTTEGKLGEAPLPDGAVQVFRALPTGKLSFVGRTQTKYIPVGEKAELDLGVDPELAVEVKTLERASGEFAFDRRGNVAGWDETRREDVAVRSGKPFPVKVEIRRHLPAPRWTVATKAPFEKIDVDTVEFKLELAPGGRERVELASTWGEGTRRELKR